MHVRINDRDLADAVQALMGIVQRVQDVNKRAMAVIIVTNDGQRCISLGEQRVAGLTFAELLDGRLAQGDFGEANLFGESRLLPFHQALERLERTLLKWSSERPGRSAVAIVRTRAAVNSPDQPNGQAVCWRRFDGKSVLPSQDDLDLLAALNITGTSPVCPLNQPRRH